MVLNSNKHNLKVGDKALMDVNYANGGYEVEILSIGNVYAKIETENGDSWDVVISRLTPIEPVEIKV